MIAVCSGGDGGGGVAVKFFWCTTPVVADFCWTDLVTLSSNRIAYETAHLSTLRVSDWFVRRVRHIFADKPLPRYVDRNRLAPPYSACRMLPQ